MSMDVIKGLVAKVQRAQVISFEEKLQRERVERRALREEAGGSEDISQLLNHYANPQANEEEQEVNSEQPKPEQSEQPIIPQGDIPPPPLTS